MTRKRSLDTFSDEQSTNPVNANDLILTLSVFLWRH